MHAIPRASRLESHSELLLRGEQARRRRRPLGPKPPRGVSRVVQGPPALAKRTTHPGRTISRHSPCIVNHSSMRLSARTRGVGGETIFTTTRVRNARRVVRRGKKTDRTVAAPSVFIQFWGRGRATGIRLRKTGPRTTVRALRAPGSNRRQLRKLERVWTVEPWLSTRACGTTCVQNRECVCVHGARAFLCCARREACRLHQSHKWCLYKQRAPYTEFSVGSTSVSQQGWPRPAALLGRPGGA